MADVDEEVGNGLDESGGPADERHSVGIAGPGDAGEGVRVQSSGGAGQDIEHIGSAHDDAGVEVLKAAARQRLAAGQGELDLGLDGAVGGSGGPLPITSSGTEHLWEAVARAYEVLGFESATEGDEVFRALVLARVIEPTSKLDSLRVLEEAGIDPPS